MYQHNVINKLNTINGIPITRKGAKENEIFYMQKKNESRAHPIASAIMSRKTKTLLG